MLSLPCLTVDLETLDCTLQATGNPPLAAVRWPRSGPGAGPGARQSPLVAAAAGGFTETDAKDLNGWCGSYLRLVCKLSEELIH